MVFLGGVYHVTEMYVTFCHLYIVAVGGVEISWFRGHLLLPTVVGGGAHGGMGIGPHVVSRSALDVSTLM